MCEEHSFATDAQVKQHYAANLYQAQVQFTSGGSVFALLGPIGVLQRYGVSQADIDTVIRAATRRLPFPAFLFEVAA